MENFRQYIQDYVDKMLKEVSDRKLYSVLFDVNGKDNGTLYFEIYDHDIQDEMEGEEEEYYGDESMLGVIELPYDFHFNYGIKLIKEQGII